MCPAPAVEPKPGVKPGTRPSAPPPKRREHPNPFRRREIRPGEEPRPKAAMESKGLKTPPQGGKAAHAFKTKKIATKSSGTGASGTTAKKAFKK